MSAILRLQRTIGNRSVQQRLHTHPAHADGWLPDIQRAGLKDLTAKPPRPAFGSVGDAEIEATDEFKKYMNAASVWQKKDKVTKPEAFLACRLIIEAIQRGQKFTWDNDARGFMTTARKLIGMTKSPKTDCPSSKYKACVKNEAIAVGPTNLAASLGFVSGLFTMEIDWHEDNPGCACCCGEYRQFVKGFVKIDGVKQVKKLFNGKTLSETAWNEDSDAKNHAYGHRDLPDDVNDQFIPDRKSGCLYRGFDTPGVTDTAVPGKRVETKLDFKGQTFDRCQKTFGSEKTWTMEFKGDVPHASKGDSGVG